jgi:hypothetical protein
MTNMYNSHEPPKQYQHPQNRHDTLKRLTVHVTCSIFVAMGTRNCFTITKLLYIYCISFLCSCLRASVVQLFCGRFLATGLHAILYIHICKMTRFYKFIHQIMNCLSAENSFITKFTSRFSPFSSRSAFHVGIIQKYTAALKYSEPYPATCD